MDKPSIRAKGLAVLLAAIATVWLLRAGANATPAADVTIFAAASLRDAIGEVGRAFTSRYEPTSAIYYNLAGSNVLAQQILASNQADVFISADRQWIDTVGRRGRLVPGMPSALLTNRLVVIAHHSTPWTLERSADLATLPFTHLSLADPRGVPAGRYAKSFLESVDYEDGTLWTTLAEKIAPTANVRSALALVETDTTVLGIVYRTDALSSEKVRILLEIPEDIASPIQYWAARVARPNASPTAQRFFEFLESADAQAIFAKHGFDPSNAARSGP